MRKQFLLAVVFMLVFSIGCCVCGMQKGDSVTGINDENAVIGNVLEDAVLDKAGVLTKEADVAEAASVDASVQIREAAGKSEGNVSINSETAGIEKVELTEVMEQSGEPETSEESEEEIATNNTTEALTEPANEPTTEIPAEEAETSAELPTEAFVAYDPNYVVALATEKTKAYGKILVWENLDRLLAEGSITQEEYEEYYPYDGLENSYYSVFVETDLNKASTTSGRMLVSEEEIADYIAEMLSLETGTYFAISYAGIYEGASGDFYEFRCHR